jgi:hypothetical protein
MNESFKLNDIKAENHVVQHNVMDGKQQNATMKK